MVLPMTGTIVFGAIGLALIVLAVKLGQRRLVIDEAGIMAGTDCRSIRTNTGYDKDGVVVCFYPATMRKVKVFTYDGDDQVRVSASAREHWPVEVWGGGDDDVLQAYSGGRPAVLLGGDGDDQLIGSSRREGLFGGPGNDLIRPGGGADHIDGGHGAFNPEPFARPYTNNPGECAARTHGFWDRYADGSNVEGVDTLDLANLPGGALADLNDCRLGYFDSRSVALVHGMENVIGTRYNDRLTGDEDNNSLRPGSGEDWVSGEAGNDAIDTVDRSADTIRCSVGSDTIRRDRRDRRLGCAGSRAS
jgi:Ca2+-binding RTX toxin-like protein